MEKDSGGPGAWLVNRLRICPYLLAIHKIPVPASITHKTMADPVPKFPVAPRVAAGPKTPHVGPDIHAYNEAHAATVGEGSDEWWAKVRALHRDQYL